MKLTVSLFIFFSVLIATAQNNINIYNFAQLPQAIMVNPSYDIGAKYHAIIPIIGNNAINIESSGFTANDVYNAIENPAQEEVRNVVFEMSNRDYFLFNQKMEIFNIGQRLSSKSYLSYGLYEELDVFTSTPSELMQLFFEGISIPEKDYKIDDYVAQANIMTVYHVGLQKNINSYFSVGGRFKIYNTAFDASTISNSGSFGSEINSDGTHTHSINDVDVNLRTSGIGVKFDDDNQIIRNNKGDIIIEDKNGNVIEYDDYMYFVNKMFVSGNKGVGIDLGITYKMEDNLILAASINDLGLVFNKNQIKTVTYNSDYTTQIIDFDYDINNVESYYNSLKDLIPEGDLPIDINENSYISLRPFKISTFIDYSYGKKRRNVCEIYKNVTYSFKNKIGALVYTQYRPGQILYDASIFYERNFNEKIRARVNYTANKYSFTNIGLAVSAQVWKINIFSGVNNVIGLTNWEQSNSAFAHFGMSVLLK